MVNTDKLKNNTFKADMWNPYDIRMTERNGCYLAAIDFYINGELHTETNVWANGKWLGGFPGVLTGWLHTPESLKIEELEVSSTKPEIEDQLKSAVNKNELIQKIKYSETYNTPCPNWVYKLIESAGI